MILSALRLMLGLSLAVFLLSASVNSNQASILMPDGNFQQTLTSASRNIHLETWQLNHRDLNLNTPAQWSVQKYVLRGGKQEGVDVIVVNNGKLGFTAPLTAITAAVVGVIASLAIFFIAHVAVSTRPAAPLRLDIGALVLMLLSISLASFTLLYAIYRVIRPLRDITGAISKQGDAMARHYLYEAANCLLTTWSGRSPLKSWGLALVKRSGAKKARVAVARKLACLLLRLWKQETHYDEADLKTA
mgnify:CR=1 FL=1